MLLKAGIQLCTVFQHLATANNTQALCMQHLHRQTPLTFPAEIVNMQLLYIHLCEETIIKAYIQVILITERLTCFSACCMETIQSNFKKYV